jgi:hypothetical protein
VLLGDGGTARETVLDWRRPAYFSYRVDQIGGPLGRVVDHAIGEWWFRPGPEGASSFTWTYAFHARSRLADPLLGAVVRTAWARYMAQCARLSVARAQDPAVGV